MRQLRNMVVWVLGAMAGLFGTGGVWAQTGGDGPRLMMDSRAVVDTSLVLDKAQVLPGGDVVAAVVLDHAEGWHSQSHRELDSAALREVVRFRVVTTAVTAGASTSAGLVVHDGYVQWPAVKQVPFQTRKGPVDFGVLAGRAVIYVPVTVAEDAERGVRTVGVSVRFQACDDRQCLRDVTVELTAEVEVVGMGDAGAGGDVGPTDSVHGLPGLFDGFDASVWPDIHAGRERLSAVGFDLFGWSFEIDPNGVGLFALLAVAAFGGFLLNLTPCVLPVIPIKIMSLSKSAEASGGGRGRTLLLGLATGVGVVGFWMAIGGAIAASRYLIEAALAAGRSADDAGFQFNAVNELFKYSWFSIGVGVVIAVMAVGMCGVFAVRLPQSVYRVSPKQETLLGSGLMGVMAAVLSTPCTAPFMGAAAGWAALQPPGVTLATFAAIGCGMASPYVVLAAFPGMARKLPRTGPASEVLKQVMGLLMLAAAAYFVGVGLVGLLKEEGQPAGLWYWWPVAGFVAAAGVWTGLGVWRVVGAKRGVSAGVEKPMSGVGRRIVWKGMALGFALGVVGLSAAGAVRLTDKGPIDWVYYTPERLAEAKAGGGPVLVEFTAEWCINCKALEQAVLFNARVLEAIERTGAVPIKVDLTGSETEGAGADLLTAVGRRTIPLLVVYDASGDEVFKGDFYSVDQVVGALEGGVSP
ncbi:MAG: thioredoxin family protein [Planctomycetota bacterium]